MLAVHIATLTFLVSDVIPLTIARVCPEEAHQFLVLPQQSVPTVGLGLVWIWQVQQQVWGLAALTAARLQAHLPSWQEMQMVCILYIPAKSDA